MEVPTDVKEFLKQYRNKSNQKGIICICTNWALILSISCLCELSSVYHLYSIYYPLYILTALFIASRLRGFENLVHEASHGNLFKSKLLEKKFKFLFSGIVLKDLTNWSKEHREHHKNLGNHEKDPDFQRYKSLGMLNLQENFYWKIFLRPLLGFEHWYFIKNTAIPFWTKNKRDSTSKCIWIVISVLVANNLLLFSLFMKYYFVPFFLILPVLRFWCEMSEHTGINFSDNSWVGKSRSNVGFLHHLIMHPFSDGYHEIHHLDEHIPWYNLRKAHYALLKEFPNDYCISYSCTETFLQMRM